MEKKIIDISKIVIGSDIEVFLKDRNTGEFKSAIGLIGGSKDNPRPLDKDGCCIQEDNVALEYNVPPVPLLEGSEEMFENISYVLDTVRKVTNIPENCDIVCCSSAEFNIKELNNPQAQEFGCEPDFNAWKEGMANSKPNVATLLRSCGGHIHVSYPNASYEASMELVRIFDMFLGVPSVLIDTDSRRRELYGKAGAFRFKSWGDDSGFEYRTLSNWWTSDKTYVKWVFNQIEKAFDYYNQGKVGVNENEAPINKAINESNSEMAMILCEEFGITVPEKVKNNVQVI